MEDIKVLNNTCLRNKWGGIYILSYENVSIESNYLIEDGFRVHYTKGLDKLRMRWNSVNNKPVGFFSNIGEEEIINREFGQLFLVSCESLIVKNLEFSKVLVSIYVINCDYVTIQNCKVLDNKADCMVVRNSRNTIIKDNLFWSRYSCDSIVLFSCKKTVIRNNTCKSSTKNYGPDGIKFFNSNWTVIEGNWIFKNSFGIFVAESSNCTITYNVIENNSAYGIYMRDHSDDNLIHHNSFIHNNYGGDSQALDKGSNNTWFDPLTKEGNYWSDYDGEGNYSIASSAKSKDPYPLNEDLDRIHKTDFQFVIFPLFLIVISLTIRRKKRKGKQIYLQIH
ncbi:MAG: right-handed parallel beta-helix repeat-containing protein [Asgard group archaeon]|nr:right-handed parallel beta-helix repeat-containing protein [Asgard group archaeon]